MGCFLVNFHDSLCCSVTLFITGMAMRAGFAAKELSSVLLHPVFDLLLPTGFFSSSTISNMVKGQPGKENDCRKCGVLKRYAFDDYFSGFLVEFVNLFVS